MYEGNYEENEIFYDAQILPIAGCTISEIKDDALEKSKQIAQDDTYFDSIPPRYKSLVPTIRYSSIKGGIEKTISEAYATMTQKISLITDAIVDYCDGDGIISEENKQILDNLVNNSDSKKDTLDDDPNNPLTEDDNDDSSNKSKDPPETTPSSDLKEPSDDTNNDSDDADGAPIKNNPDDNNVSDDKSNEEEAFIPQTGNNIPKSLEKEESSDSTSITSNDKNSDIESILFETSNGVFQTPSPITRNIDGVKKSGATISLGITTAAVAAIGGKIYYDKKKEDVENDDENDLDTDINNKTKSKENNKGLMPETNAVEFKKDLLNSGEEKE